MSTTNLLEHFILKHLQPSRLNAEILQPSAEEAPTDTKVELNLTPRVLQADGGAAELPLYQVTAVLNCRGAGEDVKGPSFRASVAFEAVYQQVSGEPLDFSEFTTNHASLARQLYPLLQSEMRGLLFRFGLSQVQMPFDLTARAERGEQESVQVSDSLH